MQRRAPAPNRTVNLRRRAPAPARKVQGIRAPGKVALRRAPNPRHNNKKFRAPKRSPGVAKSRAPATQTVTRKFRAPPRAPTTARSRAPATHNNAQNQFAPNYTPDRSPQHFDNQFASNGDPDNGRGIRFNEEGAAYPGAASVDLEILFDYNSARISPKSVRQLIILGEALQDAALNGSRIMIAGHTDAAGSNSYNANLSYRRAQSVSNFLTNYAGVSPERLAIEGYGEELLKYPDAPNSGQNRRVEIINMGS